jgi:D-glycero-D-manno-heptose 1,7-bisphosphate phosphatase
MSKAVFLDRDGVVNKAFVVNGLPKPPRTIREVEILPGVQRAISMLRQQNFEIVIVTNQPDAARGLVTVESVAEINDYLKLELGIAHVYTCFHDDTDECNCRKPQPGLILRAAKDLAIDLSASSLVGDRWRDISAGQAAGCETYFIDNLYSEVQPRKPYTTVSSLLEAVELLTGDQHGTR